VDSEKRQAVSNFFREEFLRHIEYLQASGVLNDGNRAAVDRACHLVMTRLDHVCDCSRFPAIAESLLQGFDTLTRLSSVDPRRRH
jgi:hypothetical protein